MDTTAAAIEAGVAATTIRTWCRRGVITAIKQAGRWVIDTASLAHRIAIGHLKTRKAPVTIDLNATYTTADLRTGEPVTVTTKVTDKVRGGQRVITVRGLAPLLADRINAITDEAGRLHTLETLRTASIVITDEADERDAEGKAGLCHYRDYGRLATTYPGTPALPVSVVLDLAVALRTQLA